MKNSAFIYPVSDTEGLAPVNKDSINLVLSVSPLCDKLDGIFLPLSEAQISQKRGKNNFAGAKAE